MSGEVNWYGIPLVDLPNPGPDGKFWFMPDTIKRWKLWQRAQRWTVERSRAHKVLPKPFQCEDLMISMLNFDGESRPWDDPPDEVR